MRRAINAVIIKDKKILLVKKRDIWILPGGKPIWNESDYGCLVREIREELSGTEIILKEYYNSFIGKTPYKKDELEVRVYFAEIKGELNNPSEEISEARFVNPYDYPISDITKKIVDSLMRNNFLK
jgi:ADP-ribose pyrophosphatase YjhB (NUDIX family)